MKKIIFVLAFFVTVLSAHDYRVAVKGQQAGKASLTINVDHDQYHVNLALFPSGLAKLFLSDMVDSSRGVIQQGHFYPRRYERQEKKGQVLFSVDFNNTQATLMNKGKTQTLTVKSMGQDPLTQIVQIANDIKHKRLANQYDLITEKSQQQYRAESKPTNKGYHIVLTQQPNSDRIIHLWFDSAQVLTRMHKIKRGKSQFDMRKK